MTVWVRENNLANLASRPRGYANSRGPEYVAVGCRNWSSAGHIVKRMLQLTEYRAARSHVGLRDASRTRSMALLCRALTDMLSIYYES